MNSLVDFSFDQFKFNSDSIFNELDEKDLDYLNSHIKTRLYKKKQVIFYQDSPASGIYYIKQGLVKKYKTGKDGKEQIFYISKTSDIIGYHAILSSENYSDSAAAMEDCIICFIPKEVFVDLVERSPKLSNLLLKNISHEFGVLINTLTIISQMSVRQRLALQLLLLKEKFQNPLSNTKTQIKISRDDLAALVGTAKENLVRLLHDFKQQNLIEIDGRAIVINNVKELVKESNYEFPTSKSIRLI
jgi:CRP-like cAMP-binding protein